MYAETDDELKSHLPPANEEACCGLTRAIGDAYSACAHAGMADCS